MLILDKRQGWQKALDRIRGIERSFRLDPRIENVVLALNERGVHTTQSCEGHLGHGLPYPWVRVEEADCEALQKLLGAFYQQHPMVYDRVLTIECLLADEYMLRPHGGILQESRASSEREERLTEYQAEMQCFAEWLRDRFFEESEERP